MKTNDQQNWKTQLKNQGKVDTYTGDSGETPAIFFCSSNHLFKTRELENQQNQVLIPKQDLQFLYPQ